MISLTHKPYYGEGSKRKIKGIIYTLLIIFIVFISSHVTRFLKNYISSLSASNPFSTLKEDNSSNDGYESPKELLNDVKNIIMGEKSKFLFGDLGESDYIVIEDDSKDSHYRNTVPLEESLNSIEEDTK